MYKIALLPGDGIGREVVVAAHHILKQLGQNKKYACTYLDAGWDCFVRTKTALPAATLSALKAGNFNGAIFGSVSSPSTKVAGYSSPIVQLRKELDLYANVRPVFAPVAPAQQQPSPDNIGSHLEGTVSAAVGQHTKKVQPIDILIYRENTECLYVKREREYLDSNGRKSAVAERLITEYASRRIGRMAYISTLKRAAQRFSLAQSNDDDNSMAQRELLGSLTIVHKSNVLSLTDGLFRESILDEIQIINKSLEGTQLGAMIPKVQVKEQLVDSAVYKLYRPQSRGEFDVIVAPNMYGDILSDAGAALVGSLGLVAGANMNDLFCMAEPVHGSGPDIQIPTSQLSYTFEDLAADKNDLHHKMMTMSDANPIATIRSLSLLLRNLNELADAELIDQAVNQVLCDRSVRDRLTRDIGGKGKLLDTVELICSRLKKAT
ncbi:hypothetical protein MP228_013124 [Amoeboaphelidium protococcarum]|nr:hypothetical protein MP228_013124 [Amoeboaphelidium protococcarum]